MDADEIIEHPMHFKMTYEWEAAYRAHIARLWYFRQVDPHKGWGEVFKTTTPRQILRPLNIAIYAGGVIRIQGWV